MRPVEYNDTLFYFEESTGFLYEKKYSGNDYFVPLNFCTLECRNTQIKTEEVKIEVKKKSYGIKAIQKYTGSVQLRRQQERPIGCSRFQPHSGMRIRTQGRVKVYYNQSAPGTCSVYQGFHRRNSLHRIFGTSPANVLSRIRPQTRAKDFGKEKTWVENKECTKCKSKNMKWHLSSTKECKDCGNIFRAEELI